MDRAMEFLNLAQKMTPDVAEEFAARVEQEAPELMDDNMRRFLTFVVEFAKLNNVT